MPWTFASLNNAFLCFANVSPSPRISYMEGQYDATYHLGNTLIHVVAPPPMTKEEKDEVLREFYRHAWNAWSSITVEERLRINSECTGE